MSGPRIASPRKHREPVMESSISLFAVIAISLAVGVILGMLIATAVHASAPSSAVHVVSGSTLGQSSPAPSRRQVPPGSSAEVAAVPSASARPQAVSTPARTPRPRIRIAPSVPHRVGGAAQPRSTTPVAPRRAALTLKVSWFCTASGSSRCTAGHPASCFCAAASLDLGWRGKLVTVTYGGRSVTVVIIDCLCSRADGLDLYAVAFSRLAPLSAGVIWAKARPQ